MPENNLLWWVIPGVLAGMPISFVHPDRRMNQGSALNAYDDELSMLYTAGVRAVVCLLNMPSDAPVRIPPIEGLEAPFMCQKL
jgi:hypothetical protein